jgi:hypothetical protein
MRMTRSWKLLAAASLALGLLGAGCTLYIGDGDDDHGGGDDTPGFPDAALPWPPDPGDAGSPVWPDAEPWPPPDLADAGCCGGAWPDAAYPVWPDASPLPGCDPSPLPDAAPFGGYP